MSSDVLPNPVFIDDTLIDSSLLSSKPVRRCDVHQCQARCCSDGVWLDVGQARRIREHAELIAPYLPAERRNPDAWFAEYHEDDHMPSGAYTGTTTVTDPTHPSGETCVFLRPEDRRCAIQVACVAHNMSAWELKPYYCCLFPLVDEWDGAQRRLLLDESNDLFERGGSCSQPADAPQPIIQVYAEEVSLALGVQGYRELCARLGLTPRL
ncbi:MAG: DUF3109 family protein [Anaerolineae bacterium]|nr:DUF3109 family protein [Thermoflexales bacterium]MDW8406566.1 DUF3109 family protein [Anaerolineae bacterium]